MALQSRTFFNLTSTFPVVDQSFRSNASVTVSIINSRRRENIKCVRFPSFCPRANEGTRQPTKRVFVSPRVRVNNNKFIIDRASGDVTRDGRQKSSNGKRPKITIAAFSPDVGERENYLHIIKLFYFYLSSTK